MSEQPKALDVLRYIGPECTRQIGGRWLVPGELIESPGLVGVLMDLPDFELVVESPALDSGLQEEVGD